MSTSFCPGHLNGNFASIPINVKSYVLHTNVTSPSLHTHWARVLKAESTLRIWELRFLRIYLNMTVNKANKLLGLVHRTVGSSNPGAFSTLYKSLVRPVLGYAAPVRNPYLAKDVLCVKKKRRRASRLALGQKRGEIDYDDRLRKLKWPTLETRRLYLSLVEYLL